MRMNLRIILKLTVRASDYPNYRLFAVLGVRRGSNIAYNLYDFKSMLINITDKLVGP